jgi:membrane associated rhomboid family serine protease
MAKSIFEDLKRHLKSNVLARLVLVNAVVFIVMNIIIAVTKGDPQQIGAPPTLGDIIAENLALPSSLELLLQRPWTLVTYMFFHLDFPHIFFNMIWLWSIGTIFVEYLGSKRLFGVYILGGISGALLYLLAANFITGLPLHGFLLGASAGVMAIVVGIAVYVPDYTVNLLLFGPVKLKWLALISFILTSIIDFSANTGGKVAHIGGALFGFLYILQYKKGRDLTRGVTAITGWFSSASGPKTKSHLKVKHRKRPISDEEYNASKAVEQQVIDSILDKISKSGYDSLSKREKEILFKASNKDKK